MEAEFDIAPPPAETAGGEVQLSNKQKRKLKQLEASNAQAAEEAATQAAEAAEGVADVDEEKPLSHKEKRQAKKRKLAAEAAGEDPSTLSSAPSKSSTHGGSTSSGPTMIAGTAIGNTPARSAHGVWVGNLNFATHARELLAWFKDRGLSEITRLNMPNGKRSHENNRGFAYLDFPTETDVTVAVGLSEQNLDGRKLLIKSSTDYTGRPATSLQPSLATLPPLDPSALEPVDPSAPATTSAPIGTGTSAPPQTLNRTARKILNRQRNPPGPTLFLGNLGFETTVDDIRDMFDRNQKRSREWEKKGKGEKKEKKKEKGKKKRDDGNEDEEEEESEDEEEEAESSSGEESEDDEGAGEEDEGEDGEEKSKVSRKDKKKEKGPLDLTKADTAGIRKVRLGTFEDTGKCKGWAFVDFHLPAQATRALLNLHNHQLNGRSLNVEYASAEAVRRGGLGTRAASKANGAARSRGGGDYDDRGPPRRERAAGGDGKRQSRDWDDSDVKALANDTVSNGTYDGPPPSNRHRPAPRGDGFGGDRPRRDAKGKGEGRAKPGAALAMAQRASEAIVESTGRKTTFD